MKRELVGGPLLGERGAGNRFQPLITPLVGTSTNNCASTARAERFILLPQERCIQVLAFKTGNAVANFVPFGSDASNERIGSICLARYPDKPRNAIDILDQMQSDNTECESSKSSKKKMKEGEGLIDHVVLVGCSDGTLREFSLLVLLASSFRLNQAEANNLKCGPWDLAGPCYGPRRIFKITPQSEEVCCLTAPNFFLTRAENGMLAYALVENPRNEEGTSSESAASFSLMRLLLPPYFDDSIVESDGVMALYSEGNRANSRVKRIGKLQCEKKSGAVGDPFLLESVVRDRLHGSLNPSPGQFTQQNVFLVIARPSAIHVFCERLSDVSGRLQAHSEKLRRKCFPPVIYPCKSRICSLAVSINKSDVAVGHDKGDIVFISNFFSHVENYHVALQKYENQAGAPGTKEKRSSSAVGILKPEHPFKKVVEARVHWHSHPVKTLCYDSNSSPTDPIVYSGGEESVLVTWQPSRGIDRPAEVLPRLARRGISQINSTRRAMDGDTTSANDSLLVFCEDNTLQLFETHNKRLLWKVQGLASPAGISPRSPLNLSLALDNPSVAVDPITSGTLSPQLVLNGLPDAPGVVQWYDVAKQRVSSNLEIVPYNRVSGMDMAPMPAPCVTQLANSTSGKDLMTIDEVPTENKFVGSTEASKEDGHLEFGVVTTIKFWAWNPSAGLHRTGNESTKRYHLVAAMLSPHGAGNRVCAIAMSSDGRFACTASNDEKAFRLWQKVSAEGGDHASSGRRLPHWVCQYKVSTPSGYSNYQTGCNGIAFSSDSSLVAICYGHMLTLWDRDDTTLLTSLHHFDEEDIDSVEFIKTDMILCKSQSGVSLQSPFSTPDLVDANWYWTVLDKLASVYVSCTQFIASHDIVAISIYYGPVNTSRIVLINATTGEPVAGKDGVIVQHIPGIVCSLGKSAEGKLQSNWHDETTGTESPLILYALTSEGVLISLSEGGAAIAKPSAADAPTSNAPRIPSSNTSNNEPAKKRRRLGSGIRLSNASHLREKKLSMVNFGNTSDEDGVIPLSTSDLPLLGGGFARAFVGRNLSRRKDTSTE